jgi:hypothetical protein
VRELNEQIEKQKRHEAEYARWQKVKARDEGRLKELAVELDVLKKTKTGLQRRLQQESSQYCPPSYWHLLFFGIKLMAPTGTKNGRPVTTPSWPKSDARPSRCHHARNEQDSHV